MLLLTSANGLLLFLKILIGRPPAHLQSWSSWSAEGGRRKMLGNPASAHLFRPSLTPSENDSLYSEAAAAAELTFCFLSSSLFSNLFCLHSARSVRLLTSKAFARARRALDRLGYTVALLHERRQRSSRSSLASSLEKCLLMFWRSVEDFRVPLAPGTLTHARA